MRVIVVAIGAVFLALGILGLVAGIVVYNMARQGFTIKPETLESDAHAIVLKDVELGVGEDYRQFGLRIGPDEFIVLTLTGQSNDPNKDFFVGLAEESAAAEYLDDVEYDELIGSDWGEVSPFKTTYYDFDYERYPGATAPEDAVSQNFWEIAEHGDGSRSLEWDVQSGSYWIVLMNEDVSRGIDADVELNIRIPDLLGLIAIIFIVGGAAFSGIGGILIYFGTRPPVPPVTSGSPA
jgi:hypothetical protein